MGNYSNIQKPKRMGTTALCGMEDVISNIKRYTKLLSS